MDGKGTLRDGGSTAAYSFFLDCRASRNADKRLRAQFEGHRFALERVTSMRCSNDPAIPTPAAGFDTMRGAGDGTLTSGGQRRPGHRVEFKFVDDARGNPSDRSTIRIETPLGRALFSASGRPGSPGGGTGSSCSSGGDCRAVCRRPGCAIRQPPCTGRGCGGSGTGYNRARKARNAPPTGIALSNRSVPENRPAGTQVGRFTTADRDRGEIHTYSLVSGAGSTDNASFQIAGDKLQTNASFNFEVKASYSIRVRSTDSANASTEKEFTVTINNVNDAPVANGDSYSGAIGNTKAQVQRTESGPVVTLTGNVITHNDTDEDAGDSVSAVPETVSSTGGGSATIHGDGSFVFLPGVGDKNQADSFSYKVTDGEVQSTGTVQVGIVNELVWYVDGDALPNGDGRSTSPFKTLASVAGAGGSGDPDGSSDVLFLYSATAPYTGGLPLEGSQRPIGEPEGLSVSNGSGSQQLVSPGGSNPTITNPAGDGVELANGVTMRRVNVAATSDDGITGTNVNSADIGSNLSVSGTVGVGFELSGGNGTVGFGGSVANSGARQVEVQNRTGGGVALSGAVNGTGSGVLAHNNGGATVNFTSGSVQLNTGASDAFRATGGGTVSVTGSDNTLAATSGSGLFVQNTTIGASGLNFKAIASNGGSSTGIVLDNTGSSGGLSVTGSGTAGSGGTIANKAGADGSNTTGVGAYLNNTRSAAPARTTSAS